MRGETAKRFIEFLLDQARQQNQFLLDNQKEIESDDFDRLKIIIAHTMGAIYQVGIRPVLIVHPDLTPDGLKV